MGIIKKCLDIFFKGKEELKKSQEGFFIFLGKILYLYGNLFKIKIKNF